MSATRSSASVRKAKKPKRPSEQIEDSSDPTDVITGLIPTLLSSSLDKNQLVQVILRETMATGSFIDTKFFAFSKRRATGGVCAPLPVFANSQLLTMSSRYFDGLFGADFAENLATSLDNEFPVEKEELKDLYDYDSDSDLEDEHSENRDPPAVAKEVEVDTNRPIVDEEKPENGCESKVGGDELLSETPLIRCEGKYGRVVVISDVAYKTWRAFIFYLYTGEVSFAPLRSQPDRNRAQVKSAAPRCSPKSMYRLAEKYDIKELKAQAEAAILAQLSPSNIAEELRSTVTSIYDDIRTKEVVFACKDLQRPAVLCCVAQWIIDLTKGHITHTASTLHSLIQELSKIPPPVTAPVSKTCGSCGRTHPNTYFRCTSCSWTMTFPN